VNQSINPFVVAQNSLYKLHSVQASWGNDFAEIEMQILSSMAVIPFCLDKNQAQSLDLQLP
jgi:hypothetical protein